MLNMNTKEKYIIQSILKWSKSGGQSSDFDRVDLLIRYCRLLTLVLAGPGVVRTSVTFSTRVCTFPAFSWSM